MQQDTKKNVDFDDVYTGEKLHEVRHGFGTYIYKKGSFCVKYEGEWKDGEKHGKGKLYFSDGGFYEGKYIIISFSLHVCVCISQINFSLTQSLTHSLTH